MLVLKIIFYILQFILFMYGFHFAFFTIISVFKKSKKEKNFKPIHKFLILIPARNEENIITYLIESLKKQNYPNDMYQIYVEPNNCTDKTESVSKKAGAKILKIDIPVQTKGEVLNYAFDKFKDDNSFDTYVIFDADNIVHPNFLKEMNNKIENGYKVAEGCRDTKNLYGNWLGGSYALTYYLQNVFLYKPREKLGSSANLNGTGYYISKDIIDNLNFRASTLTEDLEFNAVAAINNIKIGYASKAIFYDEQVDEFIPSITQRKRWSKGSIQIQKKYGKDLIKAAWKYKSIHALDNIYISIAPYFQVLILIAELANIIFNIENIKVIIIFGILSYFLTICLSIFLIAYYKKRIWNALLGILLFPLFMVSGILSAIMALFSKHTIWEEIKHNKKVAIEDILND